ncbi:MAG TPA: hypothetical protein VI160_04015 [Gemmatimonadales bacterium]
MKPALVALALAAAPAAAQNLHVGAQGIFADYREVSSALSYTGAGFGGTLDYARHKFSGDVEVASLSFQPASGSGATAKFTATEVDLHLRWFLASGVSFETGYLRRSVSPEFTAQALSAFRVGVHAYYPVGPGAYLTLRGNYLPGAKFSGGGSSGFAVDLGLGVAIGSVNGRFHVTGDYDFQRIDRKTSITVPIEMSLARIGARVGF